MVTCTHLDQIEVTELPMMIPRIHGETQIPRSPLGG